MNDRWKTYAVKSRQANKQERQTKETQANEIASFNFSRSDIDVAWSDLTAGKISDTAASIWKASYPRKSGHQIANEADVSIQEFVFWMVVFENIYLWRKEL